MSAVVLAAKYAGMKVDYRGMLRRAQCDLRKSPLSKFMLQELESHLTELGERYYSGDLASVDEFLQLYCIDTKGRNEVAS